MGAVLETAFHPARSGRNHLRVYCRAAGFPLSRADEVLVQVGLADAGNRRAGGYSLGMRQRLALATALLGDPAVLVLDEPANGLDPEGIQWLRGFLRHLAHEQGRTILVSSHLLSEVEQTVDRVVIVGAGRLVREGSMEQLRSGADGAGTVLVRGPELGRLAEVLTRRRQHASPTPTAASPSPAPRPPRSATTPSRPGSSCTSSASQTSGLEEIYFQLTAGQEQFAAPPAGTHSPPRRPPDDPPRPRGMDQALHDQGVDRAAARRLRDGGRLRRAADRFRRATPRAGSRLSGRRSSSSSHSPRPPAPTCSS